MIWGQQETDKIYILIDNKRPIIDKFKPDLLEYHFVFHKYIFINFHSNQWCKNVLVPRCDRVQDKSVHRGASILISSTSLLSTIDKWVVPLLRTGKIIDTFLLSLDFSRLLSLTYSFTLLTHNLIHTFFQRQKGGGKLSHETQKLVKKCLPVFSPQQRSSNKKITLFDTPFSYDKYLKFQLKKNTKCRKK